MAEETVSSTAEDQIAPVTEEGTVSEYAADVNVDVVDGAEGAEASKKKKTKEEKSHSSAYIRVVNFFSNRIARNIVFAVLTVLAFFLMFMMDHGNSFRTTYLPFLNPTPENPNAAAVMNFMAFFGIKEYNIDMLTWMIFATFVGVCFVFMLANVFAPYVVGVHRERKEGRKTKVIAAIYYFVVLLVCAAVIFVLYYSGVYTLQEGATVGNTLEIFLNLLYSLLLFLFFIVLFPLALLIAYYVLKALFLGIAWAFYALRAIVVDIEANEREISKRAQERRRRRIEDASAIQNAGKGGGFGSDGVLQTKALDPDRNRDIFPILVKYDKEHEVNPAPATPRADVTLEEFVLQFQSYACNNRKIYYELPVLRAFLSGLASSRLIILEGLSGTGKSMLPRMFSEFTGSDTFFAPVQSTWRDKTDVLGYYSEFTKIFRTKDFLNRLYQAGYSDKVNLMILDEMNLSRIEYYFADFLSVLEYPARDWKVKVIDSNVTSNLPKRLDDGYVQIPENTWFIGTANTDDSTFTITDKVYDRAIVLTFNERFSPIASDYKSDPLQIGADEIVALFKKAQETEEYNLDEEEVNKFLKMCEFIREQFDIRFGNRILNQINQFVPVYVAMGGTKEEALDFMLARKILRKLNGIYDDYIKEGIVLFTRYLYTEYGKGVFVETEQLLNKIMKRLG